MCAPFEHIPVREQPPLLSPMSCINIRFWKKRPTCFDTYSDSKCGTFSNYVGHSVCRASVVIVYPGVQGEFPMNTTSSYHKDHQDNVVCLFPPKLFYS